MSSISTRFTVVSIFRSSLATCQKLLKYVISKRCIILKPPCICWMDALFTRERERERERESLYIFQLLQQAANSSSLVNLTGIFALILLLLSISLFLNLGNIGTIFNSQTWSRTQQPIFNSEKTEQFRVASSGWK